MTVPSLPGGRAVRKIKSNSAPANLTARARAHDIPRIGPPNRIPPHFLGRDAVQHFCLPWWPANPPESLLARSTVQSHSSQSNRFRPFSSFTWIPYWPTNFRAPAAENSAALLHIKPLLGTITRAPSNTSRNPETRPVGPGVCPNRCSRNASRRSAPSPSEEIQ